MITKLIGLLVLCVFIFFMMGCWTNAQDTMRTNRQIETFQSEFATDVHADLTTLFDADDGSPAESQPGDAPAPLPLPSTGGNETKTVYHPLIDKVSSQKKQYSQASAHQQQEAVVQRALEEANTLLRYHSQNATKHTVAADKAKQKVAYHANMKASLVSKPTPSHATHQRANEHDWKTHDVKEKMHTSSMLHHQKQAARHQKKVAHYATAQQGYAKKKRYHQQQKKTHLNEGHNTGHFAYPDNYAHHHPGYYNEWDVLHERSERSRRAQDIQNSAPFAIDEVDPEHSNGFVLEQPVSYESAVPHTHLQQYGHREYPESTWSAPQTDSPVCLPAIEMERKPVHLGNTYATPEDDFRVGYLMPRFHYKEVREY
jgi:hypothetical protein